MIQNFYPNGRCDILNGDNTGIYLMPNGKIYYCYFDDNDEADYKYDLLSEVGEIWKQDILDIIEQYHIVITNFESLTEYHDIWISYDGHGRSWIDMFNFQGKDSYHTQGEK